MLQSGGVVWGLALGNRNDEWWFCFPGSIDFFTGVKHQHWECRCLTNPNINTARVGGKLQHWRPGYVCNIYIYTSSTAQGSGGSFKNRKPIGEVGCCDSGMAERSHWWTERCLISLSLFFLFLSFSLCFSIFLWLSSYLPTYLLIYLSIYLFICMSIYLPIYLSSCLVF